MSLAVSEGLGLEIAEFCTAYNMDTYFGEYMPKVREKMAKAERFTFHAPFNELCPAAIDPMVLDVTKYRYRQAFRLAADLGIRKIIVHSGYVPLIYYKSWFSERSVEFWKEIIGELPEGITVCLENVMEDEPQLLTGIVRDVNDNRFRLCLDIGHANCQSSLSICEWADVTAPYLEHIHIHNNFGERDTHNNLGEGTIPMREALLYLDRLCPKLTCTIESMKAAPSVEWLKNNGILV